MSLNNLTVEETLKVFKEVKICIMILYGYDIKWIPTFLRNMLLLPWRWGSMCLQTFLHAIILHNSEDYNGRRKELANFFVFTWSRRYLNIKQCDFCHKDGGNTLPWHVDWCLSPEDNSVRRHSSQNCFYLGKKKWHWCGSRMGGGGLSRGSYMETPLFDCFRECWRLQLSTLWHIYISSRKHDESI